MSLFSAALFRKAGLAVALAALGACNVVVEDDGPGPRGPRSFDEPGFCTREYDPVCARRGGDRQTFSNGCLADAAGYRVIRDGECRSERGGGFDEPREPRDQQYCTREYRPVCGLRRGDTRTFPNACEARAADYRIVDDGPC